MAFKLKKRDGDENKDERRGRSKEQQGKAEWERGRSGKMSEIQTETEAEKKRTQQGEVREMWTKRGWEASSDCSLGACWADRPLLRPHRQVTYLTHAAKNKKLLMCPNLQLHLHTPQHPTTFHVATQVSLVKPSTGSNLRSFLSISMTADKLQYGGATLMCHTDKYTFSYITVWFMARAWIHLHPV